MVDCFGLFDVIERQVWCSYVSLMFGLPLDWRLVGAETRTRLLCYFNRLRWLGSNGTVLCSLLSSRTTDNWRHEVRTVCSLVVFVNSILPVGRRFHSNTAEIFLCIYISLHFYVPFSTPFWPS